MAKTIELDENQSEPTISSGEGLPLGKVFSIQLRLHVSVVIIGSLIVAGLARGVLPQWHPDWSTLLIWSAAIVSGGLFFVSLLAHELAHALTARRYGIQTKHITLFLFGAMAAIEREPQTPKQEVLIAAAGPAMSLSLAILFISIANMSDPVFFSANIPTVQLEESISNLSYLGTIAFWLASINAMLGVFNLIPGFPMDGGRILRALLWWKSSNLSSATRTAARGGVIFGWTLIGYGALLVFNQHLVNGLWAAAIGYFITQLAHNSAEQYLRNLALNHTVVADLMRTRFERIDDDLPLDKFVNDYVLRSSQQIWPVTKGGVDVGFISLEDLPSPEKRASMGNGLVADCMQPIRSAAGLGATTSGIDALHRLSEQRLPAPVFDGCQKPRIVGLIHQTDVLRWVAQHPNLVDSDDLQR